MNTIYNSLRQEITCPFLCERELIKDPVVLQNCGHIFCFECVKSWLKSRKRTCPICRTKIKESIVEQDKVGVISSLVLQPNPQLKTFFGLVEILLSQDMPAQHQDDASLLRSFQQLQIETNNLKMQRQVMHEKAKLVVGANSDDEDEDNGQAPDSEDRDYEDPQYASDTDEPRPPRSNNNTPLRKSTRRYKN
jgi:hypothetical protein